MQRPTRTRGFTQPRPPSRLRREAERIRRSRRAGILGHRPFPPRDDGLSRDRRRIRDLRQPSDSEQFAAQEIAKWLEDLTDLELNQVYFDDVTGTYLFRLKIEDVTLPPESELRAIFHSADGMRLRDEYVIPN